MKILRLLLLIITISGCTPISSPLTQYHEIKPWIQQFSSDKPYEWPLVDGKNVTTKIVDETFDIKLHQDNFSLNLPIYAGQYFDAIRLDVDGVIVDSKTNGDFGVICRGNVVGKQWITFYRFTIDSAGAARIEYFNNNQDPKLVLLGFINKHSAIHRAESIKHLRVECIENRLTMNVDGVEILSVVDDSITGGMVGFSVSSSDATKFEARLDNFRVARLAYFPK